MVFNPTSEILADSFPIEPLDVWQGGQHYIYITRQNYDGCHQLSEILWDSINFFKKAVALSSITWTAIPLLKKGHSWLPLNQGLIPNDLTIELRLEKPFFHENQQNDINKFRYCQYYDEFPLYQFEFDLRKQTNTEDPSMSVQLPWKFNATFKGFEITELSENCTVNIFNLLGHQILKKELRKGKDYEWQSNLLSVHHGMLIVNIRSKDSIAANAYKMIFSN